MDGRRKGGATMQSMRGAVNSGARRVCNYYYKVIGRSVGNAVVGVGCGTSFGVGVSICSACNGTSTGTGGGARADLPLRSATKKSTIGRAQSTPVARSNPSKPGDEFTSHSL